MNRFVRFAPLLALPLVMLTAGEAVYAQAIKAAKTADKQVDARAVSLLRRMVQAELKVAYIARENTIRADAPGNGFVIKSDPKRGVRREPANGKGRIVLDNRQQIVRFTLGKKIISSEASRFPKLPGKRIEELIRRLDRGVLSAQVVGRDKVAGRIADIVEVQATRTPTATTRRFWVDRQTGLRLRTEEKDASGKVLSGSYYTALDLKPRFEPDDFTAPSGTALATAPTVRRRQQFADVAAARKAGYAIAEPGYVPAGYALRTVEVAANNKHVALRYANGLNALSITLLKDGMPPRVGPFLRGDGTASVPFPQGKTGLFTRGSDGQAYLLIGDLAENELRKIAASLH